MDMTYWMIIGLGTLILALAALAIFVSKKHKRKPDYYNFFIMGIIWTAVGVPLKNFALSGMGIIFMIAGLVHRKDWKKNRVRWEDLTESEKKIRIWIMVVLGLLVLAGFVLMFLYR